MYKLIVLENINDLIKIKFNTNWNYYFLILDHQPVRKIIWRNARIT